MFKFIDEILLCFHPCFSRKAAFGWFAIIITGLTARSDFLGITSIIRDFVLNPALYNSMMHFFRADPWDWDDIFTTWMKTVSRDDRIQVVLVYTDRPYYIYDYEMLFREYFLYMVDYGKWDCVVEDRPRADCIST